jgi:hypothetical protein
MESSLVKIALHDGEEVETIWAEPVEPDRYRLDNSPFFAYGVSWNDVVEALPAPSGQLRMTRVVRKAGHRTVRVNFKPGVDESPDSKAVLDGLVALGCSFEGANPRYVAIDLPPGVDLAAVAAYLTERDVRWEHADPRYSDLYPDAA